MVFQNYVFYLYMNVYENMVFGFKLCKMLCEEIDKCVCDVVWILQIEYLFGCKFKEFLGGQCQCVVMGCVIVCELLVFLMDELFLNFDVKLCVEMCLQILQFYCCFGVIIIYVIYDQVEVMMFGNCIVVMCDGVIMQVDILMNFYDFL